MTASDRSLSPVDARLAVILSCLEPGLTLARLANLSLDEVRELVDTGYVQLLQRRGLSWEAMARRLKKSRRTVGSLVKRSSATRPLLGSSRRLDWQRRVIGRLEAGPQARTELRRGDAEEMELVDRAVDELIEQGMVSEDSDGQLHISTRFLDLLGPSFEQRLASLSHFLEANGQLVFRRFLSPEPNKEAFARVLTFSATPQKLAEVRQRIYEELEREVFAADEAAEGSPDAVRASVTLGFVEIPADRKG